MDINKFFKKLTRLFIFLGILISLILVADVILIKFNLLRSPIKKSRIGKPDIGFGFEYKNHKDDLLDGTNPRTNSRGFETRRPVKEILRNPSNLPIAVVGDSHTNLNEKIIPISKQHPFVLEKLLRDKGIDAEVLSAGWPKYSPLQEYLVFKYYLRREFKPRVLVINLYTGNDFYDLLRVDDRPYYSIDHDKSIKINPPVWIAFENPDGKGWLYESRFIWLGNELGRKLFGPRIFTRFKSILKTAREQKGGYVEALRYMYDLRKTIEPRRLHYKAAFTAQMLNQFLFMEKHFPMGNARSKKFFRHLLSTVRMENPDVTLILSAIPSAALANSIPDRELYLQTLARISVSYDDVVSFEKELYEESRKMAREEGWIFVDILNVFNEASDNVQLYTERDLHVTAEACDLIGQAQAMAVSENYYRILQQKNIPD